MEELVNALKVVLADHYALYFKAHGHHWNMEGKGFPMYHDFYAMIADDAHGATDGIAENIRKLGSYAPFKMSRFAALTTIPEAEIGPSCEEMNTDLLMAVGAAIATVNIAFAAATAANEQGIADDLAARDGMLKKWRWQLQASLKD